MAKRTCLICQTKYDYCPHCSKDAHKPTWMMMFHDENCEQIFDIVQRHYQKIYTDEEAVKRMKERDLSVLKDATETLKSQVQNILDLEKKIEMPIEKPDVKPTNSNQVKESIVNRKDNKKRK